LIRQAPCERIFRGKEKPPLERGQVGTALNRKKFNTPGKPRTVPRRGRPSKAERKRALDRDCQYIVAKLKLNPLREPIDAQFSPYYQRFLRGDLRALGDYCDTNLYVNDDCIDCGIGPFASFYELIGRLFFFRRDTAVKQILADTKRAAWLNRYEAPRRTYEHWYERLLPLCRDARKSIRDLRASYPDANRAKLWRDYIKTAPEALRDWPESESKQFIESVKQFSRRGFVSREIFFDLAKTQPTPLKPAVIARRYACKIAGVSESWASRKNVRT
jgi:hypothetical protein